MGKCPAEKARSIGGWTLVAQLEGEAGEPAAFAAEGRPVWQTGTAAAYCCAA